MHVYDMTGWRTEHLLPYKGIYVKYRRAVIYLFLPCPPLFPNWLCSYDNRLYLFLLLYCFFSIFFVRKKTLSPSPSSFFSVFPFVWKENEKHRKSLALTHCRGDITFGNKEKTQSRASIKNQLFAPCVSHLLFIYLFIHGTEDKWTQLVAWRDFFKNKRASKQHHCRIPTYH